MATRPVQEQDRRTARPTLALSPREFAAVEQARGVMPRSVWLRDAVMEKLAREGIKVADEVRRAAPRRQNHTERQQREGEAGRDPQERCSELSEGALEWEAERVALNARLDAGEQLGWNHGERQEGHES